MPQPHPVCFILNPTSGTNRKLNLPAMVAQCLDETAVSAEIIHTEYAGHAVELARAAARRGCRIVVAVGGDGTVNEVARGLLGTSAALGILPRGSGNGLARHLKIPMELKNAIRRLNTPIFQRIDVGEINGRHFFCTAGLGFDAHVSKCFAQAGTRGLSTYAQVALREYRGFRPVPVNIQLGATRIESDCYVLAFANAAQYGNNAYIAPRANIQDGLLDLCLIDALPLTRAVRVAFALAVGDLPESGVAVFHTAREIEVTAARPIGYHVDGDYVEEATTFSVRLHPLALEVAI